MSLSKEIELEIRRMLDDRYSQREIAKKLNVKGAQLSVLLSGVRPFGGLKLDTFDKMFPHATVHLYGEPAPQSVSVTGDNHGNIGNTVTVGCGSVSEFRAGLLCEIIGLDIDPAAKDAVLRLIRDFQR